VPYAIDIEIAAPNMTPLHARFTNLEIRLTDFREPFGKVVDVLDDEARHQFSSEGDPRWPALSDAYKARKQRAVGHTALLVWSGALALSLIERWARGAITVIEPLEMRRGTSLQVGKKRRWNLGLIHQVGAPRAQVPPRPPLMLRKTARSRIRDIFEKWLNSLGEGKP
jgi:phage gpG-like protein